MPVTRVKLPLVLTRVLDSIGTELDPNRPGWIPLVFLFDWMKTDAHPGDGVAGFAPMLMAEVINRLDQIKAAAPAEPKAET
jgi:hypothetical protein